MYFEIARKEIIEPLKMLVGIVEKRQTLPILSMVLVEKQDGYLKMTANDSEIELVCRVAVDTEIDTTDHQSITLPARKLFDICKSFKDGSIIKIDSGDGQKATVKCGKGKFSLACLPVDDYPCSPSFTSSMTLSISQSTLKGMLKNTSFSIANNDVRYYLNGACFDFKRGNLSVVATDGHRMALSVKSLPTDELSDFQVIIPKKLVNELTGLLGDASDDDVVISADLRHIRFVLSPSLTITSRLIDGKFPDYECVLPQNANIQAVCSNQELKQALVQAAILSNEKFKGVRLAFSENLLTVSARNPEQEESVVECVVEYHDDDLEIGFNVQYLLDVLNVITTDQVDLNFTDGNSSVYMTNHGDVANKYVVMPMRL